MKLEDPSENFKNDMEAITALAKKQLDMVFDISKKGKEKKWSEKKIQEEIDKQFKEMGC